MEALISNSWWKKNEKLYERDYSSYYGTKIPQKYVKGNEKMVIPRKLICESDANAGRGSEGMEIVDIRFQQHIL